MPRGHKGMTCKYRVEDFDPILELVRKHCKHDRIEDFLREARKVNPEFKSSGSSPKTSVIRSSSYVQIT